MTDDVRPEVLIIDDREDLMRFCNRGMSQEYRFVRVSCAREASDHLKGQSHTAVVLLDRDFSYADPGGLIGPPEDVRNEGLHVLGWLREAYPHLPVIMVTGYREQSAAMVAADHGADLLAWEDITQDPNILRARVTHALESAADDDPVVLSQFKEFGVLGESPAFRDALLSLHRAIGGHAPILLLGETGTGKDTLAYAVHALSGDLSRPYVNVNVAALNPGVLESELFGHAQGAFTGASRAYVGKLRHADGGTLFLNEVGDLSRETQAKFLAALEQQEVVPVGDVRSHPARFRLITATSLDLGRLVDQGTFRRDLFYRIAWHRVTIPPLRERPEDIPILVRSFLREAGRDRETIAIAREAVEYLCDLPWPGNVRELRGAIEAASNVASYIITLKDVRTVMEQRVVWDRERSAAPDTNTAAVPEPALSPHTLDARVFGDLTFEQVRARYVAYLLRRTGGNVPELARRAGIAKATAYKWQARYADSGPAPGGRPPDGASSSPAGPAPPSPAG